MYAHYVIRGLYYSNRRSINDVCIDVGYLVRLSYCKRCKDLKNAGDSVRSCIYVCGFSSESKVNCFTEMCRTDLVVVENGVGAACARPMLSVTASQPSGSLRKELCPVPSRPSATLHLEFRRYSGGGSMLPNRKQHIEVMLLATTEARIRHFRILLSTLRFTLYKV